MTANLLTGLRLLLVAPMGLAMGHPLSAWGHWAMAIVAVGIATDIADGKVARRAGAGTAFGQFFDHTTDFLFVTVGLAGSAASGATPPWLPILIVLAFVQYVIDSRFLHHSPALRMSWLGRRNGMLYFAPLCLVAVGRSGFAGGWGRMLLGAACALSYLLVVSTLLSIVDRGVASVRLTQTRGPESRSRP